MARLSEETIDARQKLVQLLADCADKPSVFTRTFLKLELFPKNQEYADCMERFIVYRCLSEDVFVYTPDGIKKVSDLREGDNILGGRVSGLHSFQDDVYEISLDNGVKVKTNTEHPFMTDSGWKHMRDLKSGDFVEFLPHHRFNYGIKSLNNKNIPKIIGYLSSDGSLCNGREVRFTNTNKTLIDDLKDISEKEFGVSCSIRKEKYGYKPIYRMVIRSKNKTTRRNSNPLLKFIREKGMMLEDSFGSSILKLPREELREFVSGYFNGDGSLVVYNNNRKYVHVKFCIGSSRQRAFEFQYILWKLGINSSVTEQIAKKKSTKPYYETIITRSEEVKKILMWLDRRKYPQKFSFADLIIEDKTRHWHHSSFAKIKSIKYCGRSGVVGFETTSHEIISYCGMRTHNSGRQVGKTTSTAAKAIHFAFFAPYLHERVKETGVCDIVIVAPTQNQANIMLERIKTLIQQSEFLSKKVKKFVTGEVHLRWMDDRGLSRIYTRAAGETGTSVRGYSPTVIIADECSFLKEEVIVSLLPAGMATKARIWLTSTPYTPVGYFYNACRNSRPRNPTGEWTEFHCKSTDSPYIAEDPDYINNISKNMTEAQKSMEIEGEFLDVGDSFIPRHLIEEAMQQPKEPAVFLKFYIGVDVATEGMDETAITVIGIDKDDRAHLVELYTERRSDLVVLANTIEKFIVKYNAICAFIDETAVGKGLIDICNHNNMRTRGVVMSLEEQERIYKNLLMLFENRKIFLYGNNKMAEQLTYLKTKWTEGKKMRITSDMPDDCADSLTLACKALDSGGRMFVLKPIKPLFG